MPHLQVLDLKVHLMYEKARAKKEKAEQRAGHRSIATDLRAAYNATRQAAREEMEVKERLRQLRHKRMEEDPDDDPLLNATDAAEVLDADEDDLEEALLEVPHGYVICAALPSQEALKFVGKPASAASKELEDRRIIRRWEGFGWCVGTITSVNEDARRSIEGEKVNFSVQYDMEPDEPPVPHVLLRDDYHPTADADYDSWLLLQEATAAETSEVDQVGGTQLCPSGGEGAAGEGEGEGEGAAAEVTVGGEAADVPMVDA